MGTVANRTWRYFAVGLAACLVAALAAYALWRPSLTKKDPQRISGNVFLDGADQKHVSVDLGRDVALEFCRLVDAGQWAWDLKDQGLAVLSVEFESAESEMCAITETGLVRRKVGWGVYQVDREALVELLHRMVEAENAKNG